MGGPDTRDESVYDAYLAASAAGRAEAPEAVFARHPDLGEEVRRRIEGLWLATALREVGAPAPREMDRLGPYRLLERLDSGGMGTVFRAVRDPDGTPFAVKVLRPELAGSATAAERLRREAMALSRVRHGSVVRVHGFGEDRGVWYLVLDLVPGRGLDEVLSEAAFREQPLDPARVARWGAALARGLAAAHAEGVIHRDVKPSNVQLRPDDTPLLLDFGIATIPDRTPGALTASFAGSPFYAAPEQLTGAPVDGRADVYGLCATLYQCLAGRVPFGGDRFDAVMRRVLLEAPVPVRRLAPGVPAALETVVLAGLEKDPARRPPSAAALAEDLESALAGGPVRARRAGPVRRLARWARSRPLAAATVLLATAAAVGVPVSMEVSRRAAEERTLGEARAALREAEAAAAEFGAEGDRAFALEFEVQTLRSHRRMHWIPDEEHDRLDAAEAGLGDHRRRREESFHRALACLDRAERLAPGLEGVAACRAGLYLRQWKLAIWARDDSAEAFYRALVERTDPRGPARRELDGAGTLRVSVEPADAEVHVFRIVPMSDLVPAGSQRPVAVPHRGVFAGLPPAPWALRVVRGAGDVVAGDLLVRVDGREVGGAVPAREQEAALAAAATARRGGVRAAAWRGGGTADVLLPPGLEVRVTAAPRLPGPASLVGRGDTGDLALPTGEYAILVRREGLLDVRESALLSAPGQRWDLRVRLPAPGEGPEGFVRVGPPRLEVAPPPASPVWMAERETTAGEYLDFLNDPSTLAALDAAKGPILVPRHEVDPPLWPRGEDGRFRLPPGTGPDHPVLGVSFEDALAFARWRTGRSAARGEPFAWRLPSHREWLQAAGASTRPEFTFGPRFHPRWAATCFSRPEPEPEAVLSYPLDESPYGIYDVTGSAMEWVDDWYDQRRGLRRLCGGSWAQGDPVACRIWAPRGARPDRADREFGFRLVAEARIR